MGVTSFLRTRFKSAPAIAPGGDIPYSYGQMGYSNQWPLLMPSTRIDYRVEAGDPLHNAIIMACLGWICRTFPEAPVGVRRRTKGDAADWVPTHPLTALLADPNPYYNGLLLMQGLLCSWNLAGNAYLLKARNAAGLTRQLWYEPHTTIRPVWPDDGSQFISGYQVLRRGVWSDPVPREDVIHFRNGMDPTNPRMGLSPLASAFREIFTDNEAANFSASLLRNMGVPGVVISPANSDYTIDRPDELKKQMIAKFSGDRRGEPLVMQSPIKVEQLSFTPQQMDLGALRNIPEERITSLLGIPSMLIGIGSGLDHSTYSNYEQAARAGYQHNVLPTQQLFAAELDRTLLPEFGDPAHETVAFDTSGVRALADDQDKLFNRVTVAYAKGVLMRSDARRMLGQGLAITTDDDVYITDIPQGQERITVTVPSLTDRIGPDTNGGTAAASASEDEPAVDAAGSDTTETPAA